MSIESIGYEMDHVVELQDAIDFRDSRRYRTIKDEDYPSLKSNLDRLSLQLFVNKRNHCKHKNIYFDLTLEWVKENIKQGCALTGRKFKLHNSRINDKSEGPNPLGYSIDRIDPKSGYTKDNCRIILFCVNAFKGTMTDEQMISIAQDIVDNN